MRETTFRMNIPVAAEAAPTVGVRYSKGFFPVGVTSGREKEMAVSIAAKAAPTIGE